MYATWYLYSSVSLSKTSKYVAVKRATAIDSPLTIISSFANDSSAFCLMPSKINVIFSIWTAAKAKNEALIASNMYPLNHYSVFYFSIVIYGIIGIILLINYKAKKGV